MWNGRLSEGEKEVGSPQQLAGDVMVCVPVLTPRIEKIGKQGLEPGESIGWSLGRSFCPLNSRNQRLIFPSFLPEAIWRKEVWLIY